MALLAGRPLDIGAARAALGGGTKAKLTWRPNAGPQAAFMACNAFEGLYGGSAGGGKSEALIHDATRDIADPRYTAILFRRTFPELEKSLIARSRVAYKRIDPTAEYNEQKKAWRFSSGATIYFGHLEHDESVEAHQSAEFQYIGFDELTHFTEKQYRYMLSRARSSFGLAPRVRGGTNPGGRGHAWALRRFAPWLDRGPDYAGVRATSGEVLHYVNTPDGEVYIQPGDPSFDLALSRVFIRSKLSDNPHLMKNDPQYVQRLMGLDPVTRARLLDGDWGVREAAGMYFKRHWIEIVSSVPSDGVSVRCWDFASTEPSDTNPDPDWTVGVLSSLAPDGFFYVKDVVKLRAAPGIVRAKVLETAQRDGENVVIRLPQDPGQAGKDQVASYIQMLQGFRVLAETVTGSKIVRAGIASSQADPASTGGARGRIKALGAPWTEAYLQELEDFPDGAHDDQVDGTSDGIQYLARFDARDESPPPDLTDLDTYRLSGDSRGWG